MQSGVVVGWNNNPSVQHFLAVFRKIITRCGVKPSSMVNVVQLDECELIEATTSYVPLDKVGKNDPPEIYFRGDEKAFDTFGKHCRETIIIY